MHMSSRPGAAAAAAVELQAEVPPASAQQASGPAEPPAFRAFIDFKFVRDNVEAVAANCRNRLSTADPHLVAQLYEEYVKAQQETDRLRAARNENSSAMKVGGLPPPLPPVLPAAGLLHAARCPALKVPISFFVLLCLHLWKTAEHHGSAVLTRTEQHISYQAPVQRLAPVRLCLCWLLCPPALAFYKQAQQCLRRRGLQLPRTGYVMPFGLQGKLEPEQRAALIERGKEIKTELEGLEARLVQLEDELQREGQRLPNMTHPGGWLPCPRGGGGGGHQARLAPCWCCVLPSCPWLTPPPA